ncbi:MAG: hypothetical protein ACI9VN_000389 [Patescibacteria group bacterium]|jgi:hypothetical protein
MTNFRTKLPSLLYPIKINHQRPSLCLGSCFAEHMGKRLSKYQFPTLINPFGILYNPISIADQLHRVLKQDHYEADELFEQQGLWHHFLFHSRFSGRDKSQVLSTMNDQLQQTGLFLARTNQLIITLGTARVFIEKSRQEVVANCHKLPSSRFERKLLSVEECTNALASVFEKVSISNPKINIILTVSPIRHIRDGLLENQQSKSTLLLACAALQKQYDYVHYFPAWEIMMDDLRDYRFYDSDMIHPNETAIDYIWDYFKKGLFSEESIGLLAKLDKLIQASRHRPFQVESNAHQAFLRKQLEEIEKMNQAFPFLSFDEERGLLEAQLLEK